jgi:hypothetical protein
MMIELIVFFLAVFGLTFLMRQADGPFNIISKCRNLMMRIPWFGVQFYNLLLCPFCSGCWAALIILLVRIETSKLVGNSICLVLAGGAVCLLIESILNRLNRE